MEFGETIWVTICESLIFACIMGKIVALDYGQKRTGVAMTDALQIIASGLTTVATTDLLVFLDKLLRDEDIERIVVGEPKQSRGNASGIEPEIMSFMKKLNEQQPDMPVVRFDERFTSKMASRTMREAGLKKKKGQDKALVDQISATIILQDYLKTTIWYIQLSLTGTLFCASARPQLMPIIQS